MKLSAKHVVLAAAVALWFPSTLSAQAGATPAPAVQAPDDATRKISDLVHAGNYADAKKLTDGLLLAYPDDQRLIKAKALIEKMLAPPPHAEPAPAAPSSPASQLKGMDKIDYNALIVLARNAQQTTDLEEQKKLLVQFMDQSAPFLQKHPELTLLWQLRAASAISLDDYKDGYEAGMKLIAAGAADSNDPNLLQLLGQLKNKGWLDKQHIDDLNRAASNAASAERKREEDARYTYPVEFFVDMKLSKASYGHMLITPDGLDFDNPTSQMNVSHISKDDISYIKCELTYMVVHFKSPDQKHLGIFGNTQDGVARQKQHMDINVSPIYLSIAQRWRFIKNDKKGTLKPPGGDDSGDPSETSAPLPSDSASDSAAPLAKPAATRSVFLASNAEREIQSAQVPAAASLPASSYAMSPTGDTAPAGASEMATLHVYRPLHHYGIRATLNIFVDGGSVSALENGKDVTMTLPPGKHTISVSGKGWPDKSPINDLPMAAGGDYWVQFEIGDPHWVPYVKLTVVPPDQGKSETHSLEDTKIGSVRK